MYEKIDFSRLFDDESESGRGYKLGTFYESRIKEAEDFMGYRLPKSFVEFLKIRNGGLLGGDYSECWLTAIRGLGESRHSANSIQDLFDVCKNDLQCPDIGIPFGETQSAGHEMYYMDYTVVDEDGEPRIVLIDNEFGNEICFVANNFREFIEKVYRGEDVQGYPLYAESNEEQEKISKKLDDINGNLSLCRGGIFLAIVGLLICLLLKKYVPVAVCAVIIIALIPLERKFSKEYDRVKSEMTDAD